MNQLDNLLRHLRYFLIFLVIVIIYCLFWGPLANYTASFTPARTVDVSGEGKVIVKPTLASLSFAVITEGSDPAVVQDQNAVAINRGIDFVKEQGIDESDIKTTSFNLTPRYTYIRESGRSFIDGYRLEQTVTLKIRDLEKVGDIANGLSSRGINQITSLYFDVTDEEREEFLSKARKLAAADAYNQALSMANALDVSLGKVVSFSEFNSNLPIYRNENYTLSGIAGGIDYKSSQIEPGSQEIVLNVNVIYEIK